MFLFILLLVIIGILLVAKFKAQNPSMKSELIEFDTLKTIQQITGALRSFNCSMSKLEDDDPLASVDGTPQPAIAILMHGKASVSDAFKHYGAGMSEWGVQVIVYELGNKRHVELIALGESGMGSAMAGYGNNYVNIRHSKDYRDRIAQMLA